MTEKNWREIEDVVERGDPIKDVTDERELYDYCLALRRKLAHTRRLHREARAKLLEIACYGDDQMNH